MIEAMACGTPVIAWRCGSVPEIVDHGVTGFIVASEDEAVAALARLHLIDRRAGPRRVRAALHGHGDGPQLPAALLAARTRHRAQSPRSRDALELVRLIGRPPPSPTSRRERPQRPAGCSRSSTATRFVVADSYGDIPATATACSTTTPASSPASAEHCRARPLALLEGAVGQDNVLFTAHLTNRPLPPLGGPVDAAGRRSTSSAPACSGRTASTSGCACATTAETPVRLPLRLEFAADFRDMFEVRGLRRPTRGRDARRRRRRRRGDLALRGPRRPAADLRDRLLPAPTEPDGQARPSSTLALAARRPHRPLHRGRARAGGTAVARALPRRRGPGALRHARSIAAARRHGQQLGPACSTSGSASRAPTSRC